MTTRAVARSVGVPLLVPASDPPWGMEQVPGLPAGSSAMSQFDPEVVRAFLSLSLSTRRRTGPVTWLANSPIAMQISSVAQAPALVASTVAAVIAAATVVVPVFDDTTDEVVAERIVEEEVVPTTLPPTTTTTEPPTTTTAAPTTTTTTEPPTTTTT